jgi:hypothetical protein
MGGRKKDDKKSAKDEEEKEDAEERAVKKASKKPSWKECGHEGEERELVSMSSLNGANCQLSACQLPRPRCATVVTELLTRDQVTMDEYR